MEEQLTFWAEISANLFGGHTAAFFVSSFFFVLLGALACICLNVAKRDKKSENTPITFSLKFFIEDNYLRLLANVVIAFVVVRFFDEIFPFMVMSMWLAFVIGFVFDYVIILLRELQFRLRKMLKMKLVKFDGNEKVEK